MEPAIRYSVNWLSRTLGVEAEALQRLAHNVDSFFRARQVPKKAGGTRTLEVPTGFLKHVQGRIRDRILKLRPLRECVHGSVRGKSQFSNASRHLNAPVLVTIDVRSFFPTVTYRAVYRVWEKQFFCGPEVARLLTRLTTFRGHLPQGVSTSGYLANWALDGFDERIDRLSREIDVAYSRYVDDICLSGRRATELVPTVVEGLRQYGFSANRRKIKVMGRQQGQVVTGYSTTRSLQPSVPREFREQIVAEIRAFHSRGLDPFKPSPQLASLKGRIAYVKRTNVGAAQRFTRMLNKGNPQ